MDDAGHFLLVPRARQRRSVRLTFLSSGLQVDVAGAPSVVFPWDTLDSRMSAPGGLSVIADQIWEVASPSRISDGWGIGCARTFRGYPIGIGIWLSEDMRQVAIEAVRRSKRWWRLLGRRYGPIDVTLDYGDAVRDRERATLVALTEVLHHQPTLRDRLDNPERMRSLAADYEVGRVGPVEIAAGGLRDSVDIHTALRQTGCAFPYGRPLGNEVLAPVAEIVDAVEERLRINPYRHGRQNDRAEIEKIVRKRYLDVKPWPFRALVADDFVGTGAPDS